jgi:hypothetical protein
MGQKIECLKGGESRMAACSYPLCSPMAVDQRIEAFLTDVLALAGEQPDAIRKGVRVAQRTARRFFGRRR